MQDVAGFAVAAFIIIIFAMHCFAFWTLCDRVNDIHKKLFPGDEEQEEDKP